MPTKVALLLFGSGFCALVYQVAWLRLLRLVFGASTAASAAVLAIFMGGLGLGALLLGRRSDGVRRPLALYANLELGISLAAAASPLLILLIRAAYIALGGTAALGLGPGTLVRLLLAALVLGLPTFLMGGTLPAAARGIETASDAGRRHLALLYGANTLGAVGGALVTTFLALEVLGIQASIWAASALNLLVALGAHAVDRRARRREERRQGRSVPEAAAAEPEAPATAPVPFVLAAAALVGFAFLLMELVWYRMLAPILGGSSYTFGLILAVALLGIGAGGLLYAAGSQSRRPTPLSFATTCSLEALLLLAPFALGDRLAVLAMLLRPLGNAGFGFLFLAWVAVTVLVVLPAAVIAGYQFPLLVAMLGAGRRRLGHQLGWTYGWNTLGAIAGAIAGGFGLLPLLSAPGVWRGVTILLVALAAVSVALGRRSVGWPGRAASPVALGLVALLLCTVDGPTAFWRHTPIGAGRLPAIEGPNDLSRFLSERRRSVFWEAEGVESSVGLDGQAQLIFLLNGKPDGSALRDAPNMVMSVLVGALLHPRPRHVLVIGLGAGLSAGWLAEVPGVERVDVVELEGAVENVARLCAPVNFDVLNHPKVHHIRGDGRELLLTTGERYDLIFSQPSNPYRAGIASLFSQEFYRAAAARLRPGGLLLQWIQGYEVDAGLVRMAYATLGSVFPAVESWRVHLSDLLLVAAAEPVVHDLETLTRRLDQEPFKSGLARVWGVEGVEGLYSGYLASPAFARWLAGEHTGGLNTDDHPHMEFGFVRNLGRPGLFGLDDLEELAHRRGEDRPEVRGGRLDWERARELATVSTVVWGGTPRLRGGEDAAQASRIRARWHYRRGELAQAWAAWSQQPSPPLSPLDRLLLLESGAEAGDPAIPDVVPALVAAGQGIDADGVLARWHFQQGRHPEAVEHLISAFVAARRDPWPYLPLLARDLLLSQEIARLSPEWGTALYRALGEPFAVNMLEELRWRMRLALARSTGSTPLCVEALGAFEPHVPWEESFLRDRLECYHEAGDPRSGAAEADLQRFLAAAPPPLEAALRPGESIP